MNCPGHRVNFAGHNGSLPQEKQVLLAICFQRNLKSEIPQLETKRKQFSVNLKSRIRTIEKSNLFSIWPKSRPYCFSFPSTETNTKKQTTLSINVVLRDRKVNGHPSVWQPIVRSSLGRLAKL